MRAKVISPLQEDVLTALFDAGLGERGYYLTGGTALAEYYLQHRHSDDLDLFTRAERDLQSDIKQVDNILASLGLRVNLQRVSTQHVTIMLESSGTPEVLKIEFAKDVPARMAPPLIQEVVHVDSFEDIAVNKVCTILSRSEPKDFCDLYFILKESKFRLEYLLERAKEKEMQFETDEGKLLFAANLMAAGNLEVPLRMIKPLSNAELRQFLVPVAKELFLRMRPGEPR
jgi:predicted nucleotidyltransferase component of viral defense system